MRLIVVLLLGLFSLQCAPPRSEAETMLADACAFLWTMQGEDGGWHSPTHGLLKGGQAWTPFVLLALLEAPDGVCAKPTPGVERALAFVRNHVNEAGALGLADPDVLEYPNYATAYALRLFARHGVVAGENNGPLTPTARPLGVVIASTDPVAADLVAVRLMGFDERRLPLLREAMSTEELPITAVRSPADLEYETIRRREAIEVASGVIIDDVHLEREIEDAGANPVRRRLIRHSQRYPARRLEEIQAEKASRNAALEASSAYAARVPLLCTCSI